MTWDSRLFIAVLSAGIVCSGGPLGAQDSKTPTTEDALKLKPIQSEIRFDTPDKDEVGDCSIRAEKIGKAKGWVVRDPAGQILRRFIDTNGDNVVDQWCYYESGLEVYRDIDTDFNGKADQYRWLNTAGARWALDTDEDGQIDLWKEISPEEVTAEVVGALGNQDTARFARLLLTQKELSALGLSEEQTEKLAAKIKAAISQFKATAAKQKVISQETQWLHFGGTRPGLVPEGTNGSTKDLRVYENVVAVVGNNKTHGQVRVGTMIQVGDNWRIIDLPIAVAEDGGQLEDSNFFFAAATATIPNIAPQSTNAPSSKIQELLTQLEELDKQVPPSDSADAQANYNAQRTRVLEQLSKESDTPEDREQWIRQLADMVSAAVQSGGYPDGVKKLQTLYATLDKDQATHELAGYVKYRYMTAEYVEALQTQKDFTKVQTAWLENLEQFVKDYPKGSDAPEAMLQLAIAEEFAGQEDTAKKWYTSIVRNYPESQASKKAAGANTRLDSVGKSIDLKGKTADDKAVDLARYKGKTVVVHYWATWCEPCKSDMVKLKELQSRYARSGLALIGVNLDNSPRELVEYLKANRLPWPHIYEPGGLDSRLANEMGILTLPTMILIDSSGKVVDRNIHVSALETELKTRLK
jgi:thiol-disulfide isomerase/thioredoxin